MSNIAFKNCFWDDSTKKSDDSRGKKQQYKFENDLSLQYANGETSLSKMLNTEGISESYRRSLITKWGAKVQDYKKAMEAEKKSIKDFNEVTKICF